MIKLIHHYISEDDVPEYDKGRVAKFIDRIKRDPRFELMAPVEWYISEYEREDEGPALGDTVRVLKCKIPVTYGEYQGNDSAFVARFTCYRWHSIQKKFYPDIDGFGMPIR